MNNVSNIKPLTDDLKEAYLGAEYDDVAPDYFEFDDVGEITGIVIADDTGVEATIQDAHGGSMCFAIEWTRAEHNRAILKAVRAAAFNAFSVRVFITVISMIGFVKAN